MVFAKLLAAMYVHMCYAHLGHEYAYKHHVNILLLPMEWSLLFRYEDILLKQKKITLKKLQ